MFNANRNNPANIVLARMKELAPGVIPFARLVGRWVWVEYPAKPSADVIDYLIVEGFRWNPKRRVWQHAGGVFTRHADYDPRQKYGVIPAEEVLA